LIILKQKKKLIIISKILFIFLRINYKYFIFRNSFPISESIRTSSSIKHESESISRKRKQSITEESNIIALRKKKSVSIIEIQEKKPRKQRNKKPNSTLIFSKKIFSNHNFDLEKPIPIREPSPLPIIDQSKHYSIRFSKRK
jgi:hypothetical protein